MASSFIILKNFILPVIWPTTFTALQFMGAYYSGVWNSSTAQSLEHRTINPSPLSSTGLGLRWAYIAQTTLSPTSRITVAARQPVYTPDEFNFIALTAHRDIPTIPWGMPKNCKMATVPVYGPDGQPYLLSMNWQPQAQQASKLFIVMLECKLSGIPIVCNHCTLQSMWQAHRLNLTLTFFISKYWDLNPGPLETETGALPA